MGRYVIRRLLHVIPVLIIISFLTIAMLRLAPGDPAATLAGEPIVARLTRAAGNDACRSRTRARRNAG